MTFIPLSNILALPMPDNAAGADTIRDYLMELLLAVWDEGEGFSGKRPFGTSCWESDLYVPLVRAGLIDGKLDEDGYPDEVDQAAANQVIAAAIREMCAAPTP